MMTMQLLMANANSHPQYQTESDHDEEETNCKGQRRALEAKPAEVQPPQHKHTDDFEFRAVGKSEDDELQETTMKQARSASPKPTNRRPAGSKAVSIKY